MHIDDLATKNRQRFLADVQASAAPPMIAIIVIVISVGALMLIIILGLAPLDPVAAAKPARAVVVPSEGPR